MRSGNLVDTIRNSTKQHWSDAVMWFLFTVLVSLLPVWGSCIIFRLFSLPIKLYHFISDGEFAIYSAALLAPTLYMILKEFGAPLTHRTVFGFIAIVGLLISAIIFGGVTAITSTDKTISAIKIDQRFLATASIILFVSAGILTFFIRLLDTIRTELDIYGHRKKESVELSKDFDAIRSQD